MNTSRDTNLQEASDPQTTPEHLTRLSQSEDEEILAALAENPNTPPAVLFKLGEQYPHQFLQNPALSLLVLESPDLFSVLPWQTARSLARCDSLSLEYMAGLVVHPNTSLRSDIAANPRLTPEWLALLVKDSEPNVRMSVAIHPKLPMELLHRLSKDQDRNVRCAAAGSPLASEALLRELYQDEYSWRILATNPNTPVEILRDFAEHRPQLREAVAKNPSLPLDLLVRFAKKQDILLLSAVVMNPSTPADILASFVSHHYFEKSIVGHRNVSPEVLRSFVAQAKFLPTIASNPSTPLEILSTLAQDKSSLVRRNVANNPSTPPTLRQALLEALNQKRTR